MRLYDGPDLHQREFIHGFVNDCDSVRITDCQAGDCQLTVAELDRMRDHFINRTYRGCVNGHVAGIECGRAHRDSRACDLAIFDAWVNFAHTA